MLKYPFHLLLSQANLSRSLRDEAVPISRQLCGQEPQLPQLCHARPSLLVVATRSTRQPGRRLCARATETQVRFRSAFKQ